MKLRPMLLIALFGNLMGFKMWAHAETPVVTVPAVDIARYGGKWFEIASFPMFFQRNCIGDTTAEYGLNADGTLSVLNRCRTKSGFDEAKGKATIVDGSNNARLKVSFFWPFKGDYWVIGLDPDYRWALVGNPNRKYLWVLSRTPQLSKELLDVALKVATEQGFDLTQIHYTVQSNQKVGTGG